MVVWFRASCLCDFRCEFRGLCYTLVCVLVVVFGCLFDSTVGLFGVC